VKAALDEHPRVRALFVQASETSTCALQPRLPALARSRPARRAAGRRRPSRRVGVFDLPMDRLDRRLVTGSQKALMLPPGLAFVALSSAPGRRPRPPACRASNFDSGASGRGFAERSTAWTPAISLVVGLRVALHCCVQRAGPNGACAPRPGWRVPRARPPRRSASACSRPSRRVPAATAVMLPEGLDGTALFRYLRDRMRVPSPAARTS